MPGHELGVDLRLVELLARSKASREVLQDFNSAIVTHRYLGKLPVLVEEAIYTLVHS